MQYSNGKFIYLVYLIASNVRLRWVECKGHFPTSIGFNIIINWFVYKAAIEACFLIFEDEKEKSFF